MNRFSIMREGRAAAESKRSPYVKPVRGAAKPARKLPPAEGPRRVGFRMEVAPTTAPARAPVAAELVKERLPLPPAEVTTGRTRPPIEAEREPARELSPVERMVAAHRATHGGGEGKE